MLWPDKDQATSASVSLGRAIHMAVSSSKAVETNCPWVQRRTVCWRRLLMSTVTATPLPIKTYLIFCLSFLLFLSILHRIIFQVLFQRFFFWNFSPPVHLHTFKTSNHIERQSGKQFTSLSLHV